jgi:hypothetical protein
MVIVIGGGTQISGFQDKEDSKHLHYRTLILF